MSSRKKRRPRPQKTPISSTPANGLAEPRSAATQPAATQPVRALEIERESEPRVRQNGTTKSKAAPDTATPPATLPKPTRAERKSAARQEKRAEWRAIATDLKAWPGVPLLLAALVLGAILRFYGLNWDGPNAFHPDESTILAAASRVTPWTKLDPEFQVYNGFTVYLYHFLGELVGFVTRNPAIAHEWEPLQIIGRACSALFSFVTVVPLYLLARRLFSHDDFAHRLATLAAMFYLLCVGSFQTAHYGVTESFLTLCICAVVLHALRLVERPDWGTYFKIGLWIGLALAAKTTGAFFAIPFLAAQFCLLFQAFRARQTRSESPGLGRVLIGFLLVAMLSLLVFAAMSPYTFLKLDEFKKEMQFQGDVVSGAADVFWTLQFHGTPAYTYWLQNLPWYLGLAAPFAILGMVGLLAAILVKRAGQPGKLLVFLAFPLGFFLYIGPLHAKYVRYMVPMLPFLCISTAWLLQAATSRVRVVGRVLTAVVTVASLLWALAFFSIYTRENTLMQATRWIAKNAAPGSVLLGEANDMNLPVGVDETVHLDARTLILPVHVDDNDELNQNTHPNRAETYADLLAQTDYIAITSRRYYANLPRLEGYPLTNRYYRLLFAGKLGFTRATTISSYPSLLGVTIPDDKSEESFQVFDHPKVILFHNTGRLSRAQLLALLTGTQPPTDSLAFPS